MSRRGEEMTVSLHRIADEELTGRSQAVLREAINEIEKRDALLEVMGDFIESEYRAEFEETLDEEMQDLYRDFYELDHDERVEFDWPGVNGQEWND